MKEIQCDWMRMGIATKEKINKALDINQKKTVLEAKGQATRDCFVLWKDSGAKAGKLNKKQYLNVIQGVNSVDDENYDKIVQINRALKDDKTERVLLGMVEILFA